MVISVRHCAKRVKSAERTKLTKQIKRTKRKQGEDHRGQSTYRSERQRTHVGTNLRADGNQRAVRIVVKRREYHFAMTAIASSPATGRIVGEPVIRDNPFVGAGNIHDVMVTGGTAAGARRVWSISTRGSLQGPCSDSAIAYLTQYSGSRASFSDQLA